MKQNLLNYAFVDFTRAHRTAKLSLERIDYSKASKNNRQVKQAKKLFKDKKTKKKQKIKNH